MTDDGSSWGDPRVEERVAERTSGRSLSPELGQDLRLAIACGLGISSALQALDLVLREEVARVVGPMDPQEVDEVTQLVREKLLVGSGESTPRIEAYRAEAPLRAWIRAVALRTTLNHRRGQGRELPTSQPPEVPASNMDAELELIRARFQGSFRTAFAAAIESLGARERTILRLHTLDGVTLARIGAMYQKDTSTISRWLEQIRQTLLASTRSWLEEHLRLSPGELDSVMRAADSEMNVSLHRLLAPDADGSP
jgi:RNA polymerase sigma-70 factor (ECF subfamily)